MQLPNTFDRASESETVSTATGDATNSPAPSPAQSQPAATTAPAPEAQPKPITELVLLPDFPKCTLGQFVEIGGFAGTVVEIVNQSIKLRTTDGSLQSYNGQALRKLYAPMQRPAPSAEPERTSSYGSSSSSESTSSSYASSSTSSRSSRDDEDGEDDEDESAPDPNALVVAQPDFTQPVRPIAEVVILPDYPKCLLGLQIDIGGFSGVVVQLNGQSMRVRSRSGDAQNFNANVLRRIYGPTQKPKVSEAPARPTYKQPAPAPAAPVAQRNVIANPDFTQPVKPLQEFVTREDFPQCTFGQHIEINGINGVVIEIVKGSMKVKSSEGVTRSYNAIALRRLHA